jgi:hypothetical protein
MCSSAPSPSRPASEALPGSLSGLGPALLAAGVVGTAHAWYVVLDQRLPRDPGLYYRQLPAAWEATSAPFSHLADLGHILASSSGWYNLLLASGMHVIGRGPMAFGLATLAWVVLLLVGVALVTRGLGSGRAALAATLLVGAMPTVVVEGRTPWIHVPEAALALACLAAWQRDPGLERRLGALAVALAGVLLITLRESGLVWAATLAPLLIWSGSGRRRWRRILLVLTCWAVAALVPLVELQAYLSAKFGARERYEDQLPDLVEQTVSNLSWPVIWAVLGGLVLMALPPLALSKRPARVVLAAWVLAALGMWAAFRAGLDNFTPAAAALGILAGLGLSRLGSWGVLPALGAFAVVTLPQALPVRQVAPFAQLPGFPDYLLGEHPNNYYRPWRGFAQREVQALLSAVCPAGREEPCVVVTGHGMFSPFTEDPGELELFLLGRQDVKLVSLRESPHPPELAHVDALVTYRCPDREAAWRERYPYAADNRANMIWTHDFRPIWTMRLYGECRTLWMTPQGEVPNEAALPTRGQRLYGTEEFLPENRPLAPPLEGGRWLGGDPQPEVPPKPPLGG